MDNYYSLLTGTYAIIFSLVSYLVQAFAYYKLAEKAKIKNSWLAFIPFLQFILFFHIIDKSGWNILFVLLAFIPIVGAIALLVLTIVWQVKFYKNFDTATVLIVLCIIFCFVAWIYLIYMAFSENVKYVGETRFTE